MQLRTSPTISFFGERLRKKFGFLPYEQLDKPTLFFGLYGHNDRRALVEHRGKKIVFLNGTDASYPETVQTLQENKSDLDIIAGSRWIAEDLQRAGLAYTLIPLVLTDIYDWPPTPLGQNIYWYGGKNSKYGKHFLKDIQAEFANRKIIILDKESLPQTAMRQIYADCFVTIRLVGHDGQSQTAAEAGLMGRYSLWNGQTPFAIQYRGLDDVIAKIHALEQGYDYRALARRSELFFREQEATFANFIMQKVGLEAMDYVNIFKEDIERCGSIFRIQRKKDIIQIGGLGFGQFERPWYSQRMQQLGKKQIITTKNSGWVATEWKGTGNKGYPRGVSYHTLDNKYV